MNAGAFLSLSNVFVIGDNKKTVHIVRDPKMTLNPSEMQGFIRYFTIFLALAGSFSALAGGAGAGLVLGQPSPSLGQPSPFPRSPSPGRNFFS